METNSKDLDEYIERYCKKHKITPEEARKHQLVKDVAKYYEEIRRSKYGKIDTVLR